MLPSCSRIEVKEMVKRIRDKSKHDISAYARKPADGRHKYRVPRLVRARTIASDHPGPEACKGSSTKLKVALPSPSKSLHGLADN